MTKVTGPLHSEGARGTIAGGLTFSLRLSGQQVRWQKKQKDVSSPARLAQRAKFLLGRDSWNEQDMGNAECGAIIVGGREVNIASLPVTDRAPQFARYVGDWLKIFYP